MSTKYIASNWRLPNEENSNKSDNYGLSFDGTEYIDCGNISHLSNVSKFSISFWFNLDTLSDFKRFLGSYNSTSDWISFNFKDSTGELQFIVKSNTTKATLEVVSSGKVEVNNWYNVTVVYDGTLTGNVNRLKVFLNNNQETLTFSGTIPSTSATLTNPFFINRDGFLTGGSSKLSEVAIFDYALSSTQISTLYGSSSLGAGNPMALKPAPVAFWNLADNSASNPLTQPNEAVEDASVFDFNPSSNQYINCGNILDQSGTDAFSISGWFYLNSTKSNTIVSKMNSSFVGYQLYVNAANKLKFLLQGTGNLSATGSTVLSLNTWYNVILTYDGSGTTGGINLFLNGATESFTGSGSNSGGVSNSENFEIGARTGAVDEMDGLISNVAFWNSDQSSEISNIYNSGVPATTYTNTPTAWYKLDQSANWDVSGSGYWDIPDASGNGNDGTSSGMTSANLVLSDLTRAVPYDSYSFNFDSASSDAFILPTSTFVFANEFSLSVWVNPSTFSTNQVIFGDGSSSKNWLRLSSTTTITFKIDTSRTFTESSGNNLVANTWQHLLITRDASNIVTIYRNGVIFGASTSSSGTYITSTIGYRGLSYFDGKLSNVSLFNEELTSTEVLKLYANGVPQDLSSFSPAPVAWYTLGSNSFWNGSNWICRDLIGSNDGTSANAGADAIVGDAPRSEANGVGTNNSIPENLVGTTKWSSNNSWSINMSSTARVEDTP